MNQEQVVDREQWNATLLALPTPHALQTWEWGQVKRRHNWVPTRLLWKRDGQVLAAAQVLRRPVPHTPWGISYVPKGPILDDGDDALVDQVLSSEIWVVNVNASKSIYLNVDEARCYRYLFTKQARTIAVSLGARNTGDMVAVQLHFRNPSSRYFPSDNIHLT